MDIEDRRAFPGEIIALSGGGHYLVRLADGREVVAVVPKRLAREAFLIRGGERVEVVFPTSPRMPRVIQLLRPDA